MAQPRAPTLLQRRAGRGRVDGRGRRRARTGRSQALMIIGTAAILIGAFTDSDASGALIGVGAVVALTGLYFYLQ